MNAPKQVLGIAWGSNADEVSASFGLTNAAWESWGGDGAFVTRTGPQGAAQLFGASAGLRLFAADGRFEGAQFSFSACAERWPALRAAVIAEFALEDSADDDLYVHWQTGEVVRLANDRNDDTCQLTVAGRRFGSAYARYVLRSGFAGLTRGLGP